MYLPTVKSVSDVKYNFHSGKIKSLGETSIDGEVYENGEILSYRTPVRFYYYKVMDEAEGDVRSFQAAAEAWADKSLPKTDSIRGMVKKVRLSHDEIAMNLQKLYCKLLNLAREDIIKAYSESLRFNAPTDDFVPIIALYKRCIESRNWKGLAERDDRKRKTAEQALSELLYLPGDSEMSEYRFSRDRVLVEHVGWRVGELQEKIDNIYPVIIDLKRASALADNVAGDEQKNTLRKMRKMEITVKRNLRATRRAAGRAEASAEAAAASAASAAASAADARISADFAR